ncbi:MAG: bifunctional [glutamate--ammonia ligase]-adenylyl-L-tyrosine phosphorylase/[glutamate--ammonia-ligase] adenylyltransferase [Gammaproteobacteria bacterium]|nr:bifunctional [glutamate--ammonia ligase]-adenylyl-L-tyrosine phosphorylase/[glutamate--ammonia-ligase] adenylyltransferase [Gammaproteobacteria bacterium]NNJ49130.1 bifunctional [glutamate--ammonia ligase]-adenylyl-L-tyrosine phosphorylase/[glutamate--ammonia-ligase] adenylyltransferase [Gammaproteobacteria bacterium]
MSNDAQMPTELLARVPQSLHSLLGNYWADWCGSCEHKEIAADQGLPLSQLGYTWACSDFVARNCIRYPDIYYALQAEGFDSARDLKAYRKMVAGVIAELDGDSVTDQGRLMSCLRLLRQKEMLRIAWRDLNGLAEVALILQELTDFSEAIVAETLHYLEKQQAEVFGMPLDADGNEQSLLVYAMGKMGGGELNFSSDIDLIFTFPDDGETTGRRHTSHYEFYVKVIRNLVKVLDEVTADGFVYRVDIRLRPFGQSGPMAMSFSGVEQYYQLQGRDWERYAMIKARLITGREEDKQQLQSMLTPFVYRRYLDFSMLESIREMKAMINAQMKSKGMENNIKLGPGGIREIEFIGQTLQLIRAGREPELRQRSLIRVLTLLGEKSYLQNSEVEQLVQAYWFLRKLENRLQMQRDMQTHTLPEDEASQIRLCLAMQFENWEQLQQQLAFHQESVDHVFQHLIANENEEQETEVTPFTLFWSELDAADEVKAGLAQYLETAGYSDIGEIIDLLVHLRSRSRVKHLADDSARLLTQLMQSLLLKIADYPDQARLLDRVCRIIQALAGRKVYISLLNEYPAVQLQMLTLCSASEWFTERLIKYPILLDSLMSTAEAFRQQHDVEKLLALELARIDSDDESHEADLEQLMDRLRQFKRQMVFTVAMLDVFYAEPVETVSDYLTELADILLQKILALSWKAMVERYGEPGCIIDGEHFKPAMSVVAYGKMGGNELGYGSDLDVIFLHNSSGEKQYTSGEKCIDNQSFFARVAQRVIHLMNTRTYSGILYEVDTRLRPDGQSGLMVSSISAFESYQHEKAWTWEHQALIRARFVTGNALIEQEFDRIRSSVLRLQRDEQTLLQEVADMREKMRLHLANSSLDFDLKQDAGGLVDIEFMTQAGVLLYAHQHAECIKHTATLELIRELSAVGWYEVAEAERIADAYRYFRKLKNWQNLDCEADLSAVAEHRDKVISTWQRLMPEAVITE